MIALATPPSASIGVREPPERRRALLAPHTRGYLPLPVLQCNMTGTRWGGPPRARPRGYRGNGKWRTSTSPARVC